MQCPLQHLHVHRRVRLSKAVLHLAINHLFARHRQTLVDEILIQRDFGFCRTANQMHVDVLRTQCITQGFCGLAPFVIQRFMVQQRDDGLIALGGEVVNLEQLMAQQRIITHAIHHQGHQLVNQLAGRRETVHADTAFGLLIEDDVIKVVAVMPDAEFGTHTVVTDRGAEHLRRRRSKRRHHTLQTDDFLCQLRVVLFCREVFGGHDAS